MKLGWARVSKKEQHLDLQLSALMKFGCDKILHDKISGKAGTAPELEEAIISLKKGDTLVVWHLDRLGRNARGLMNLEYELKCRGISLVSLSQHYDTSTLRGEQKFLEDCVKAQEEIVRISERTTDGLEDAARRGHYPGQPKRLNEPQVKKARLLKKNKQSVRAIATQLKCAPSTAWRALQPDYLNERKGRHVCKNIQCDRITCIRKRRENRKKQSGIEMSLHP